MTNEELQYVDSLKNEISRLEQKLELMTEEKQQAVALASKYMDKYIKDNNLTDEVSQGIKTLFSK